MSPSISAPIAIQSNSMPTNSSLCPTTISMPYEQYHQLPHGIINTLGGWVINPSIQTMPQIFHPMYNPHQQYSRFFLIRNLILFEDKLKTNHQT